jgi:hypothetical protein
VAEVSAASASVEPAVAARELFSPAPHACKGAVVIKNMDAKHSARYFMYLLILMPLFSGLYFKAFSGTFISFVL